MFRLLGLPRGTTLERLTFSDLLGVANTIIEKALELKVCTHTLSMQIHIYIYILGGSAHVYRETHLFKLFIFCLISVCMGQ